MHRRALQVDKDDHANSEPLHHAIPTNAGSLIWGEMADWWNQLPFDDPPLFIVSLANHFLERTG